MFACSNHTNIERMIHMELQEIITKVVKTLTENEDLLKAFLDNPTKVLEKTFKVDLPDDQINAVVDAVKAKVNVDNALDAVSKLAGLFGKK